MGSDKANTVTKFQTVGGNNSPHWYHNYFSIYHMACEGNLSVFNMNVLI